MRGVQARVGNKVQPGVKKGVWDVIITDPSLNKFTFGPTLISRYIMTDIISPYGQKSILYNTIPSNDEDKLVIKLNFEDIDDGNISDIKFQFSPLFHNKWNVKLLDNRNGDSTELKTNNNFEVDPVIQQDKLFSLGFVHENQKNGDTFFELHLIQK